MIAARRGVFLVVAPVIALTEAYCWAIAVVRLSDLRSAVSGAGGASLILLLAVLMGIVTLLYLISVARGSVYGCAASLVLAVLCVLLVKLNWIDAESIRLHSSDGLFVVPLAGGLIFLACTAGATIAILMFKGESISRERRT